MVFACRKWHLWFLMYKSWYLPKSIYLDQNEKLGNNISKKSCNPFWGAGSWEALVDREGNTTHLETVCLEVGSRGTRRLDVVQVVRSTEAKFRARWRFSRGYNIKLSCCSRTSFGSIGWRLACSFVSVPISCAGRSAGGELARVGKFKRSLSDLQKEYEYASVVHKLLDTFWSCCKT